MRSSRNDYLVSLSREEFSSLDPWSFINDPESKKQWTAEVRKRLRTSMPDMEILSILGLGLYDAVSRSIKNHADAEPERRGLILFGAALQWIRRRGISLVYDEIPGYATYHFTDDGSQLARRSHELQDDYSTASQIYEEALEASPVFLSEGIPLADSEIQLCHRYIEAIRCKLTTREHQVLRLIVIEEHTSQAITEILEVSQKQVSRIRRGLKDKLAQLAHGADMDEAVLSSILAGAND